jgi:drug/metabolite transporter (DMT)-like permease
MTSLDSTKTEARAAGPSSRAALGVLMALSAISIWVGWFISTRFLIKSHLTAEDITVLRFGVSGLVLLPVAIRDYTKLKRLALWRWAAMVIGAGAPYVLITAAGLSFAPASHAAALTPGVMPLFVALLSMALLKEKMARNRKLGFLLILSGVIFIAGLSGPAGEPGEWKGHLLFLLGAFMWACYTIALRGSGLNAVQATAAISVTSILLYLPFYALSSGAALLRAPASEVLLGAFYQGLLTGAFSLIAYAKAVELLGASRAAAFAALIPVLTLLFAIPLLGEAPTSHDIMGIVLVSLGVFFAAGANVRMALRRHP